MLRYREWVPVIALVLSAAPIAVHAQQTGAMSDSDYIAKILGCSPGGSREGCNHRSYD